PHEALPNLYIASTRRSALDPSFAPSRPDFALPLAQSIVHATRHAAASCNEEHLRGSLAVGLAADFAVLDTDPFTAGEESLLTAQVVRTVVAGETVYEG
ncbi:MAG TPA: amidohydrolase family protein, partial [Agromyces sp.]|nr:amidohydrolase family protein [Agromyces sp.]